MKIRLFAMALMLAGCATDPAPHVQMSLADQALTQAQAAGVDEQNDAFRRALKHYELAYKNMLEQDFKRARMLAEKAELEARVAELQTLKDKDQAYLKVLIGDIARIREALEAKQ